MDEYLDEQFDSNEEQHWICSNQDKKLKIYISKQSINIHDLEIPIYYVSPSPDPEDNDIIIPPTEEKSTEITKRKPDIIKKVIFKSKNCLRGRKRKNSVDIGQTKIHDKLSKDNILIKINVQFLSFVILLANSIVEYFGFKGKFIDLDYNFKKTITKKSLKNRGGLTFKEILCNNISKKWKKHSSDINRIFYRQVIKNENIEKIFSQNYLTIFEIFHKNQRNIKIGDAYFYLPPEIKMFDTFVLNIKNNYKIDDDSLYIQKINEGVEEYIKRISVNK
jgi:hypothetical protein